MTYNTPLKTTLLKRLDKSKIIGPVSKKLIMTRAQTDPIFLFATAPLKTVPKLQII
jgi:hypothetical protein